MNEAVFYIAAASPEPAGGIYQYEMQPSGVPVQTGFHHLPNASYFAFSADRNFFYSTCTVGQSGGVAAFRMLPDGSLEYLNACATTGISTCHLAPSPEGNFLYAANYSSGNFTEFKLENGAIAERTRVIAHVGRGVNVKRQEMANPHFAKFTPDGRFLCVIDLGIDTVRLYPFDPVSGIDAGHPVDCRIEPAGSGPRHLIFDASGEYAYLLNELGNSVAPLQYDGTKFVQIGGVATLPRFAGDVATKAAAIRLSADGRFLFASNRGYDSIAVFEIDAPGKLRLCDMVLSGGSSPRDINFLPGERFFAAANEFSNNVMGFDFDPATGKLTPNGWILTHMPRPLCIAHLKQR